MTRIRKNVHMDGRNLQEERIAGCKRALQETRGIDDVEAFANAWRALADLYGRVLDDLDAPQSPELVVAHVERVRERVRERYQLHA